VGLNAAVAASEASLEGASQPSVHRMNSLQSVLGLSVPGSNVQHTDLDLGDHVDLHVVEEGSADEKSDDEAEGGTSFHGDSSFKNKKAAACGCCHELQTPLCRCEGEGERTEETHRGRRSCDRNEARHSGRRPIGCALMKPCE